MAPAELWSMPVHHFAFAYFEPPEQATDDPDSLVDVRRINLQRKVPYFPNWLLKEYRITSRRL